MAIKITGGRERPPVEVHTGRRELRAGWEFERSDARLPVGAGGFVVLGGEPEGAVIHRVHRHGGVITPAFITAQL